MAGKMKTTTIAVVVVGVFIGMRLAGMFTGLLSGMTGQRPAGGNA